MKPNKIQWWIVICSIMVLVPAFAQTDPKETGKPAVPAVSEKEPAKPAAILPEEQRQMENLLSQMKQWPLAPARRAANAMIAKKQKAIPFLLILVRTGEPGQKEAAAYCLGQLKVASAFPLLVECIADKAMRSRLEVVFTALVRIDANRAYPILLRFLESDNQTGHTPALRILGGLTQEKHLPLLQKLLEAKSERSRKYAIELIAKIPTAWSVLLEALHDPSPSVAGYTVPFLGKWQSEELRTKLQEFAQHHDRRFQSFIILIMIEQEDAYNLVLFKDAWIPELIRAVRSSDYFVQGAAASALVNVGFRTDQPEITELMDKYLVPILIETLAGKVYFREYLTLRPIGLRKLKQLTGKDLGPNMERWWAWWNTTSSQFKAIRLLKGISEEQARSLWIEYSQLGLVEQRITFVASAEVAAKFGPQNFVVLNWNQTREFLNLLQEQKFLEMEAEYGQQQPNLGHIIEVKLEHYRKKVTVYSPDPGALRSIVEWMLLMQKQNHWQIYWDESKSPDWLEWYQTEEKWFLTAPNAEARNLRLKRMILSNYGGLRAQDRDEAALELLDLMKENQELQPNLIQWGLFHVRSEPELPERLEHLITALAMTHDPSAISNLCEFLISRLSTKTRQWMLIVLYQGDDKLLHQYIRHPNPYLRATAAEILGKRPPQELTVLYLTALIQDEHIVVQQSAIAALGELKAKAAWDQILKIVQHTEASPVLRQAGILSLAKISPQEATTIILPLASSNDPGIRGAVTQALAEIGGTTAIQTLANVLRKDAVKTIQESAGLALSKVEPKPEALDVLVNIANQSTSLDTQIIAIQAIQRMNYPPALDPLGLLLNHAQDIVRIEAALALAEQGDVRAIPVLIANLGHPRYNDSIRKGLEELTFFSTPDPNVKEVYENWWQVHQDLSRDQWLLEAMRSRGYSVTPFLDYLLEGKKNKEMIPVWIQALQDLDWFIRAAAAQKLNEFTGQSFGKIYYYTGIPTTRKIAQDWRNWWMQQK